MPALEALVQDFSRARVQVVGISVDSNYCHASWGRDLGGISFPLLADFHPKGQVASAYGLYLEEAGITDRATVLVDAGGIVRHASSVGPAGKRDMKALLELCRGVDAQHGKGLPAAEAPQGLPAGARLYVKSSCGHSKRVLTAAANLGMLGKLEVCNVSEDAGRRVELEKLAGSDQAPCLTIGDEVLQDSSAIIERLVRSSTGLWAAA